MTLFISGTDKMNNNRKVSMIYTSVSVIVLVFSIVYEIFSHGVISYYMIFAFLFPLLLGAGPFFLFGLSMINYYPPRLSYDLYHSGVASLTVGSIMCGVLDIYGTTSNLLKYYFIVGCILILLAVCFGVFKSLWNKLS